MDIDDREPHTVKFLLNNRSQLVPMDDCFDEQSSMVPSLKMNSRVMVPILMVAVTRTRISSKYKFFILQSKMESSFYDQKIVTLGMSKLMNRNRLQC